MTLPKPMAVAGHALCLLMFSIWAGVVHAQAAYVQASEGPVEIKLASGEIVQAKAGELLPVGASIEVGSNAKVTVQFADGQVVALLAQSALRVDDFRFNPSNVRDSVSALTLIGGTMRLVTGTIGTTNPAAMRIDAGGSRVSVQGGADFMAVVDPRSPSAGSIAVLNGAIAVNGARVDPQFAAQWSAGVTGQPVPTDAAPAVLQSSVTAVSAIALPEIAPVAVTASARAAATQAVAQQAVAAARANPGDAQLQVAAQQAATAAQAASTDAQALSQNLFGTVISSLAPAAAGQVQPVAPPASVLPTGVLSTITPPVTACVGSPC